MDKDGRIQEIDKLKDLESHAINVDYWMNRLGKAWGRTWKEDHMKYTFRDYRSALEDAGPKLKELVLYRAAHDPKIDFIQLRELVDLAYPDI